MSTVVRWYIPDQNPQQALIPGVPLRDLTEEEWQALPEHVRRDVDASGLFRRSRPRRSREDEASALRESEEA